MRLTRDTALKIHYVLDQWLPPYFRDARWFMRWPMQLLFRHHADAYLDFKDYAFALTEEEFRSVYRQVSDIPIERETDLNTRSVQRILEEVRGPKVLEAGCGKGFMAKKLLEKGFSLTVTDIIIQQQVKNLAYGLQWKEANVEALPFADKAFDTVICTHTLEHVRNLQQAIAELRRVAHKLIVIVPRQRPYKYTFDMHLHFFPYAYSLAAAFGRTEPEAHCEDVDGDWLYIENNAESD